MRNQDELYMRRALQLALHGEGAVSPNPMVGAVIVNNGMIIGEGYHRKWGEAHAEVNAVNSVADKSELEGATIYVTLEPCSHYGKTPPCAKLLIDCGFSRVVIGASDPFEKVSGRGIEMLKNAGIEVTTGILEKECKEINRHFMYAHTNHRPYILLKWAQSSDGFIASKNGSPVMLSNRLSKIFMHRERNKYDAIMVGTNTVITDNPSLTVREWPGRNPRRISFDRNGKLPEYASIGSQPQDIIITEQQNLTEIATSLYNTFGITSLMVEGGRELLQSFIDSGLYDEVRVEISDKILAEGVSAPIFKSEIISKDSIRNNKIALKRS